MYRSLCIASSRPVLHPLLTHSHYSSNGPRLLISTTDAVTDDTSQSSSFLPSETIPLVKQLSSSDVVRSYWKLSKGYLSVWVALSAMPGYLVCAPFSIGACTAVFM